MSESTFGSWGMEELKGDVKCKHDLYTCADCGISMRNTKAHTTIGGEGLVARLRKSKKKKKR